MSSRAIAELITRLGLAVVVNVEISDESELERCVSLHQNKD